MNNQRRSLSCLGCLALAAGLAFGQATTSVRGHITDPSGAAIPGAQIHLTRTDTNVSRDTVSNNEGFYEILQLAPGVYQLTVKASGFTEAERTNLELRVSDATLGNAFDNKQIEQLPIEARNVVELLSLQPGVLFLGNRVDAFNDSRSASAAINRT